MRTLVIVLLSLCAVRAVAQDAPAPADKVAELEARLAKLENAPAKTSLSAFNPAMGMALDGVMRSVDGKGSFEFRSAELGVEAPVDPYLKGWAIITGSNGTPAVDVEEAALETTSLPYNLIVRGGRLFASFGRLAHFHDHELPVVDRPRSLDTFVGGETRADGVEAEYLFPTDLYLRATLGAYDKMGAQNTRQDPAGSRTWDQMTYLGRLATYADVTDGQSLELGLDSAWTPKRNVNAASAPTPSANDTVKDTWRALAGADLTYRWQPSTGGLYKGAVWGTEVMLNDERRFDANTDLPTRRVHAWGGFTYVQLKMGPHWRPGVMFDATEDPDVYKQVTKTYTAFLTYDVTEFQRLRLEYARSDNNAHLGSSNTVALQWTGVLGHHVHGFRDR